MTSQEQYRIRECNGVFTIQKKRFIKQFRMFRPSKIVEQWEDVDSWGFAVYYVPYPVSRGMIAKYESLSQAQVAMQQFIEGVKYHYPGKSINTNSTFKDLEYVLEKEKRS